jgi:ribosomal protein S12 methylthiotransferase accessory factor
VVDPGQGDASRPAPGLLDPIVDACRRPLPKVDVHGHRSRTISETWALVEPLLPAIGVTRLADVTGLDQIGITVYQAVVPDSRDTISTYSGKGLDRDAARVSAAMEAYERYYGTAPATVDRVCSFNRARAAGWPVLDPREAAVTVSDAYTDDAEVAWSWGYDIAREVPVLVAVEQFSANAANPGDPAFDIVTTNGLASGNNLTEAVLHGLYEVVERDAWTLAEVVGQQLPDLVEPGRTDDAGVAVLNPVDVDSLPRRLRDHVRQFTGLGITLQLFMVRADTRVPTCLAVAIDEDSAISNAHLGLGTDADPEIAVGRAVTEVAQSRCVDSAGGREDLAMAGDEVAPWAKDTRRGASSERWRSSRRSVALHECDGYASDDITQDLQHTVQRLRQVGLDRVIVVDLSPSGSPFAVCKVLVPGAEVWASDRGKVGVRLTEAWNAAALAWEQQTSGVR